MKKIINKPIIGVIKRKEENALNNYMEAVYKMGGVPICVSNFNSDVFSKVKICDGIIFTGGTTWSVIDEYILKYCLSNDVPFLGICLGMQMIGNYFSFDHEIGVDKTTKIDGKFHNCNLKYCHEVILKDGYLSSLFGTNKILVNSNHNYKVKSTNELIIKGYSPDGVIEALEIPNHKFGIGVGWHPERMLSYDKNSRLLFKSFINEAFLNKLTKV